MRRCLLLAVRSGRHRRPELRSRFRPSPRRLSSQPRLEVPNPLPALRHDSILSTVGKTPVVRLQRLAPPGVEVYVKVESFNPMGSVKDRLAHGCIEWAERTGELSPGQTVVEASSGNTGIGLAMVTAAKGYDFVCVMSEAFSIERRKLMRFLGAKVVLTNPAHKGTGMVLKARELAEKHGWFLPRQFENEANAWMHEQTTGPEIIDQFSDRPVDFFFTGTGTGGTLNGVGRVLRQKSPDTKIIVCEPDNAPMLYSGVPSDYKTDGSFKYPHPMWRPHLLQGWTPDWIPKLVADAVDRKLIDDIVFVSGEAAMDASRALATQEGIFTGTSGGGTLASALEFARTKAPQGSRILVMLPDTGDRYLSTPLFENIPADMTEEEKAIEASTPGEAPPAVPLPDVTPEATKFVEKTNVESPLVVWSLQECEFCWTAFGLLDALGVPYTRVDIDAFKFAKGNMGNKYRAALSAGTGVNTFPQIFAGGAFIGGAVDACMLHKKGELRSVLEGAGAAPTKEYEGDPFEFLPKWMTANPLRSK